jgi:hypothetical protein
MPFQRYDPLEKGNMRQLERGEPVVLISSGECGVVVHAWPSEEVAITSDYYVAFFGKAFPSGKPKRIPYIRRYAATCLRSVVIDERGRQVRWRLPLHAAVEDGDVTAVRRLLRESTEQEVLDGALQRAVLSRSVPVTKLLIRHRADVNALDERGGTPLFRAVYHPAASRQIVETLLKAGARVNEALDVEFIVPGSLRPPGRRTALHHAASVAPSDVVRLLLARGADPNLGDKKRITPLMVAASEGRDEIVRCLLECGADATATDRRGFTALSWAKRAADSSVPDIRVGAERCVRLLPA